MTLWQLSIRRPVLATVLSLAIVLFGSIGYFQLPVRELPDIDFPIVSVLTILPGASPEVVEKEVTEVLEEEISTIEGIKVLTSSSSEQVSQITVEFELDRDIDVAAQDVRDKVSRVRSELPPDAEEPQVSKIDLDAQAILWISVNSPNASLRELTDYADNVLKERLQRLPGVGSIVIGGEKRLAIRVRIDADRLSAHELTVDDVVAALQRENVEIPSGRVEGVEREFVVQTKGEISTPEAFNDLVIAWRRDQPVRLREVATASEGDENERGLSRFNLVPHISLGILKQARANTVDVARAVRGEIELLRPNLPPGYEVRISFDGARFIEESVAEVQESLLIAAVLVVLVILLFLHSPRSAIIPTLAIPTSVLGTFGLMYAFGFTINTLTLLALVLTIGVVVDDAIIVLENVHRHMEEGKGRLEAALLGTDEIAFAAIAATLTLVAVFVPVAFISGVVGRFFFEFGVTVAVAILVSLFVALTLTPMMCSRLLRVDEPKGIFRAFESGVARLAAAYRTALTTALDHRIAVALVGLAVVLANGGLFLWIGREFVPPEDRGGFRVLTESPEGATLKYHDRLQFEVERILRNTPEVRAATSFVGLGQSGRGPVNSGIVFTRLHDRDQRERSQDEVLADVRARFSKIPGLRVFAVPFSGLPTGNRGKPLQFIIQNPDFGSLQEYGERLVEAISEVPGVSDVDSNLRVNKPEVRVHLDRDKAAALGISAADVANTLRVLLGGQDVTKFKKGNERYDVIVQLAEEDRASPAQVGSLYVRPRSGELVQLSNLLEVEEGVGPSSLYHHNRRRSVIIDANLSGLPLGDALGQVEEIARKVLPPGFTTATGGESKDFEESISSLAFTFALAVAAVFLVLAAQFESFVHPFTILLALPLALFGALLLLLALGMTLNVYSFIGLVMLVGLVTKNSILLVDQASTLRGAGYSAREAMIEAGAVRLRPILMTALSTLVGMIPVAAGLGAGAESRRPLGAAVAGGMLTSTILTLIIVPVFYTLVDDALGRARRRRQTDPVVSPPL